LTQGGIKRAVGTLTHSDIDELANCLGQKIAKIELLLNPREEKHMQLAWHLREAHSDSWNPDEQPDPEKIRINVDKAIEICQEIIKTEWDRTKEGK
jgi:hypothetical protein